MSERIHTILWRRIDQPGTEYCTLRRQGSSWYLAGTAMLAADGVPLLVRYEVVCDDQWRTRDVLVTLTSGSQERTLRLRADEQHNWWLDGEPVPDLAGCIDIDLGITPSTNTLPIRRLDFSIGESQEVDAAWVRFPDLSLLRLPQRYTRLAANRYRYQSRTFTAELEVNDVGLTLDYAGVWTTVATRVDEEA